MQTETLPGISFTKNDLATTSAENKRDQSWYITIYLVSDCSYRTLSSWFVPTEKNTQGMNSPSLLNSASPSTPSMDLLMLYSPSWSHSHIASDKGTTLEQTEIRQSA